MSKSFTQRIFSGVSVEGSGPLTRSIAEASTSGFIDDNPAHWAVEPYIPIETNDLLEYLGHRGELQPSALTALRDVAQRIETLLYQQSANHHRDFSHRYARIDPDDDSKIPGELDERATPDRQADVISVCEALLTKAGYRRLNHDDIEACVGVASPWGVPLHVDFDLFKHLVVYSRGDIVGTRIRRRWRKLYRHELAEVPIYQRMVVIFALNEDYASGEELAASSVHMRMFKNIPQQDIDMLLPGTSVKLSGVDRGKSWYRAWADSSFRFKNSGGSC